MIRTKILISLVILLKLATVFSANVPVEIMNAHTSEYGHSEVNYEKLKSDISEALSLETADYHAAKVQMVFSSRYYMKDTPDYLVVYLMSKTTYSVKLVKVELDESMNIIKVENDYNLKSEDQETTAAVACPDETVTFVAGTCVPEIHTAGGAVDYISEQAEKHGFKVKKLVGPDASVANYKNWLSCPKLRGFFNVGHGYNQGILLADGTLMYKSFDAELKGKLHLKAIVVFNSCEVHNLPLKKSVTDGSQAQKFIGGITTLQIGPSEEASKCFWNATFHKDSMTKTLPECNKDHDSGDEFGISGNGQDIMEDAISMLNFLY